MKIKCLLVDDEPIALDVLAGYIQKIDVLELVGRCQSAVEVFSVLQNKPVDLLFLDIQMPQLSGLELLRTLPNPPRVILTTAYREYALDGYELSVLDYLVKPIPFDRFMKAVGKLFTQKLPGQMGPPVVDEEPFIFVREDRKLVRITLQEIISLESLRDYVRITTGSQQVVTRQTIGYFEELLPADRFMRIHRSFIVALAKIEAIADHYILAAGHKLPIGRNYKLPVFERLQVRKFS